MSVCLFYLVVMYVLFCMDNSINLIMLLFVATIAEQKQPDNSYDNKLYGRRDAVSSKVGFHHLFYHFFFLIFVYEVVCL